MIEGNISKSELARRLKLSERYVHTLLKGKTASRDLAERIAKHYGGEPEDYLRHCMWWRSIIPSNSDDFPEPFGPASKTRRTRSPSPWIVRSVKRLKCCRRMLESFTASVTPSVTLIVFRGRQFELSAGRRG